MTVEQLKRKLTNAALAAGYLDLSSFCKDIRFDEESLDKECAKYPELINLVISALHYSAENSSRHDDQNLTLKLM